MILFQENARMEGQKDKPKDGWTVRPYFIGPFWLPPGVQYRLFFNLYYDFESSVRLRIF